MDVNVEFGTDFIVNTVCLQSFLIYMSYILWFRKGFTCDVPVWMQILMYVREYFFIRNKIGQILMVCAFKY